jgi:hypothetical protein
MVEREVDHLVMDWRLSGETKENHASDSNYDIWSPDVMRIDYLRMPFSRNTA